MTEKDKYDSGEIKNSSDEMTPDELVRRLSSVYSEKTVKEVKQNTESDPEIDRLLKKYISEEPDESVSVVTPDFENIQEEKTKEQPASSGAVVGVNMRFKVISHTVNGIEMISPNVDTEKIVTAIEEPAIEEPVAEPALKTEEVVISMPELEPVTNDSFEELTVADGPAEPTDTASAENVVLPDAEIVTEEAAEADTEVDTEVDTKVEEITVPSTEDEYADVYSDEFIYSDTDIVQTDGAVGEGLEAESVEEPVAEAVAPVINTAEETAVEDAVTLTEDAVILTEDAAPEEVAEPTADEAIAQYLESLMARNEPEPAPAAEAAPVSDTGRDYGFEVVTDNAGEGQQNADTNDVGINGDGNFDETDINLMLALGLEDELAKTVGMDAVSKYSQKMEFQSEDAKNISTSAEARTTEYVNISQTREILDEYSKVYSGVVFKIIASLILAVALFCYENLSLFGVTLGGPFNINIYPIVYYMVDIQLLVFTIAVMYRNFFPGIARLFTLRPTPDSLFSVAGLVSLIYTVLLCVLKVTDGVRLMAFPVAVIAVLCSFYEFFNLRREVLSFNVISSKKSKYAFILKDESEAADEKAAFNEYTDQYSTVAGIEKVSFIDGFFGRTDEEPYYGSRIVVGIAVPLIIALVISALDIFLMRSGWASALSVGVSSFLFCLPATILYAYSVPFYRAEKTAYEEDGAIIGEAALDEYASTAILTVDDDELFRSYGIKVRSVKIYGDNRIDKVIYDTASIFNGLGGLLGDVLRVAAGELGYSDKVEYSEIGDDGITANVDGEVMYVGSRRYIEAIGVNIPDGENTAGYGDDVSVMYLANSRGIAAKMYITYTLEAEFHEVAKELDDAGICLAVNSTDPNITDDMLKNKMPENRYPVKVLRRAGKPKPENEEETRINSGIVARGSIKSLLSSILLCDKVRHIVKTNTVVKVLSMIIGAAVAALLLITGNSGNISSVFVGLYQIIWYLPMLIITRMYI